MLSTLENKWISTSSNLCKHDFTSVYSATTQRNPLYSDDANDCSNSFRINYKGPTDPTSCIKALNISDAAGWLEAIKEQLDAHYS